MAKVVARKVAVLRRKDPFAVVGDAMAAAADAVKKSTSDAKQAASQAMPAVRSVIAQSVYVIAYYTSFGVVFTAAALSRVTPMDNAFGYGIRDGAAAARTAAGQSSARKVTPARTVAARRPRARTVPKTTAPVLEAEP